MANIAGTSYTLLHAALVHAGKQAPGIAPILFVRRTEGTAQGTFSIEMFRQYATVTSTSAITA
jgi:hypothetical protein